VIRPARAEDAGAMARIRLHALLHTGLEAVPDEEMQPVHHPTWVWDQDGVVAGFVTAGEDPPGEGLGCLVRLYVQPSAQGAGVGKALLTHAEAAMRADGLTGAVLLVETTNEQARRFYEARGWVLEPDPEVRQPRWEASGVRYRRRL